MEDKLLKGVSHTIQNLHRGIERDRSEPCELEPTLALLRAWQSNRLRQTYADLIKTPRYRPACDFFMEDVYAPRDFSQRDQDFEHLYHLARRFIPDQFLDLFKALFELNTLTHELDRFLLDVLLSKLNLTDQITSAMYAQAYRMCDNYSNRKYQIDLLVALIHDVGIGARQPLVWPTLQLARVPASLGGWNEIYDFAVRGYQAFQAMRHPSIFAQTIENREMKILNRIFAGDDNPFNRIS